MRLKYDMRDLFETNPSTPSRFVWGRHPLWLNKNEPATWLYIGYNNPDTDQWWAELFEDLRERCCTT